MDLIDYYNLIIEGECTILDVRTKEQFLSQHIKTAKYVDQDSTDTYTSLILKRKVLICYEDQYPQQQMIDFISRMKGVEEVVCLHFPDLSREYPFLCQNSFDNTSSSLELYPTRLLFQIHFLFIFLFYIEITMKLFMSGQFPPANLDALTNLGIYYVVNCSNDV